MKTSKTCQVGVGSHSKKIIIENEESSSSSIELVEGSWSNLKPISFPKIEKPIYEDVSDAEEMGDDAEEIRAESNGEEEDEILKGDDEVWEKEDEESIEHMDNDEGVSENEKQIIDDYEKGDDESDISELKVSVREETIKKDLRHLIVNTKSLIESKKVNQKKIQNKILKLKEKIKIFEKNLKDMKKDLDINENLYENLKKLDYLK